MIVIEDTIISDAIIEAKFCCDLPVCKGFCCIEGDEGAPLDFEEAYLLEEIFPIIKEFMTDDGIKIIEEYGAFIDNDGEVSTPLINNKECAYSYYDENGIVKCAIEKAYESGKINFIKPISCHLYPIRIIHYSNFDAVNYHEWEICSPACKKGKENNISLVEFLKIPLIRKYGEEWFNSLCDYLKK
jgi:hypothetical protein